MKSISRRGLFKMGAALAAAPSLVRGLGAQRPTTARDGGALEPAARVPVNATRHTLLRGGTVITMDPAVGDFAKGDVHIQGKRIVAVGRDLKAPAGAQIIDAAGTIVIPGFVDCHRHSWSAQFRRIIPDGLIANYMATTHQGFAQHYRPHDMAWKFHHGARLHRRRHHVRHRQLHNSRSAAHSDAAIEALSTRASGACTRLAASIRNLGQAVARGLGPFRKIFYVRRPVGDSACVRAANKENWRSLAASG